MNEFLIDCSFKKYSMALKFDLCNFDPALCRIARDHGPALCGIARDHGPALCHIALDQHIFVNSSANSKIF
jgi:hypothetical protein